MANIMLSKILLLSCVLALISTQHGVFSTKALSEKDIEFILNKHNQIRQAVHLPKLKWDEELAQKAQKWANSCNYWHSNGDLGENIGYDRNQRRPRDVREALSTSLRMWMREKSFDTRRDLSCCGKQSQTCCHYAQILWRTTTSLGCGFNRCNNMGGAYYTVCNYFPK